MPAVVLSWGDFGDEKITNDGANYKTTINRVQFEAMNAELFQKTTNCVEKALTDAKIKKGDVNDINIVGGASHTPKAIIITYL